MSMSRLSAACIAFALLSDVAADDLPQLGQELSAAEVEAADYTVMPDGRGLPPGEGTAAAGSIVYTRHCAACHGTDGSGGPNDRLVGGHHSLQSESPVKTVGSYWPYATTLFDYVRRAMPYTAPGTLSSDDIYAVTAYLLHLNGIVGKDAVLDADSLPRVKMPNRDNFDWSWPDAERR